VQASVKIKARAETLILFIAYCSLESSAQAIYAVDP